jgi:hypothetical protein
MKRQLHHPQPTLFDEDKPRAVLKPAQEVEMATLVKTLMLEIATAPANVEADDEQDQL